MPEVLIVAAPQGAFSELLVQDLSQLGYRTHAADSIREASSQLGRRPSQVVLTEDRLPDGDALDLLALANAAPYRPSVVVILSRASTDVGQRLTELGAAEVLIKPLSTVEVTRCLERLVGAPEPSEALLDVLRSLHHQRASARVALSCHAHVSVDVQDGEIVHARAGETYGREALLVALEDADQDANVGPLPAGSPRTIHQSFRSLLLQALADLEAGEGRQ